MHDDPMPRAATRTVSAVEACAAITAFPGRAARLLGGPGTGKTTALVERAAALAHGGERVILLTAPSARAVAADALLRRDPVHSPKVRTTTWHGLARAVVAAEHPELRFVAAGAARELVATLLGLDSGSLAVDRTVRTIDALRTSWLGRDEILTHADAAGVLPRWEELCDVCDRYEHHLRAEDLVDGVGTLLRATLVLREADARRRLAYDHVIVDDLESVTFAQERLLFTIASPADEELRSLVVAGDPDGPVWEGSWGATLLVNADRRFATTLDLRIAAPAAAAAPAPVPVEPVRVHHRAVLGEAVIGEVQRFIDEGMRADEIAIVASSSTVESSIAAAARRHGVPIASTRRRCGDDPVVARIAQMLVERAADPRRLSDAAFGEWTRLAPRLLAGDATPDGSLHPAVPAVRAFIDALAQRERIGGFSTEEAVHGALDARTAPARGVSVVDDAATRGRRWGAVIVTGCEEGQRPPRPTATVAPLDLELLHGPDVPDVTERHGRTLTEARRRFDFLRSRATTAFVAIAAPEPGVLVSRFLEADREAFRAPHLPVVERRTLLPVPESHNDAPLWTGPIRASASSLETYLNCPLQFTLRYVLGVDSPSGVQAAVGTLVHTVLERFLSPANHEPRTRERLAELLEEEWRDDLFTYKAQAAEFRARVTKMLLSTWFDGEAALADDVAKVEHHFQIDVAGHTLSGFIDRIDRHVRADGTAELEIIDYKTGSWKNARAGEESLQLGAYYLAAKRDPELAALGEPTRLRLHFVDAGKDADQRVTTNHEALWETAIGNVLRDIETQHWQPSDEADCEYCDFQRVCPNQPQGRVVPLHPPRRSAS